MDRADWLTVGMMGKLFHASGGEVVSISGGSSGVLFGVPLARSIELEGAVSACVVDTVLVRFVPGTGVLLLKTFVAVPVKSGTMGVVSA